MSKTEDFFSSPITSDPEWRRTLTSLLKSMLLVVIAVAPLILVLRLIVEFKFFIADYTLVFLFACFSIYYMLLKKDKFVLVSSLFILTSWGALTLMAATSGGTRDVSIIGYILLIFLSTLFKGYKFSIFISILSLFAFWLIAIAEFKGVLIPTWDQPLYYARDFSIFIILILVAVSLFERSFSYSYHRISKELHERIKTQKSLSKNEAELLERNKELNDSNARIMKMNEELVMEKEKAEKSDKLKTSFLQNISHEIRTPMNGIVGFAELLKDDTITNDKKEEYIQYINTCTYQLASVVNDLIDISKIEAGDIEMVVSDFTVSNLVEENIRLLSSDVIEKGLDIVIQNDLGNTIVRSDFGKIGKVLYNLISNAVKFTSRGSIKVSASKENDNLVIAVTDTGIGIDGEQSSLIFDRFRQVEIGLDRSFGGTGLGLAISKGNIDFLGGSMSVESEPGKGSIFSFSVPVIFLEEHEQSFLLGSDFLKDLGMKILIADDDEISYLYLKELFQNRNCEILHAKNGLEAVEIFTQSNDVDLVLMDLKMPDMNGYEAARIIRINDPKVPLIAITAFVIEEDKKRIPSDDFDDYVVKPIDKKDLFGRISRLLSNKQKSP